MGVIFKQRFLGILTFVCILSTIRAYGQQLPDTLQISSGWMMADAAHVGQSGGVLSGSAYKPEGWYPATVPGTVLTTLVHNKVYPEPLYGEHNRPDRIPESLSRRSYWYRTSLLVPERFSGRHVWLNFDGVNYAASVWVNGHQAGDIRGAFTRGLFDISPWAHPGQRLVLAVRVDPQPHPGQPHEHTIKDGMGSNGGITAIDGPTFLCSIGWDWIPAIRDRNTGLWQKVYLSATGPVRLANPLVTTDVALPGLRTADVHIETTLSNESGQLQKGILKGRFANVSFHREVTMEPHSTSLCQFSKSDFPQLHMRHPRLWWPNGYGPQNMYQLKLSFVMAGGAVSDRRVTNFGIRKITYAVADAPNLTISVNGVKIFCKGGDWGMDEAMKRIPRKRLEAEIRMHQQAHFTMIRNWVGQSTSEDFYDLCDQYGILLWDEFFQPNPGDGPNPTDIHLYIDNVREKILRFRNHPCIAVWCGRNEGYPPKNIDSALRGLMRELDPVRVYQPSSTAGRGVNSGGPYHWQPPAGYYDFGEAFKTEIGSVSIPTLQSIHAMMPQKDWEVINDDWAEHDFASGAQDGLGYRKMIGERYGRVINLADFVRKAQLANYEAFRAMYEGRNARLFSPSTGVLTWMSNPAQPSFVWQIYHHDLEPNAALFAAMKGCAPIHIQLNQKEKTVQVINNLPEEIQGAHALLQLFDLNSKLVYRQQFNVTASPSSATTLGAVRWPEQINEPYFVRLVLRDHHNKRLSDNFYWMEGKSRQGFARLANLPVATLGATIRRRDRQGKCYLHILLHNKGSSIALMTHLQVHRRNSIERVLPVFYSDNYVTLVPGASKAIDIEFALADLQGADPEVLVDGWNVHIIPVKGKAVSMALNKQSLVSAWPETGLPVDAGH